MRRFLTGLLISLLFVVVSLGLPLLSLSRVVTSRHTITDIATSPALYQLIKDNILAIPAQEAGLDEDVAAESTSFDPHTLKPVIERYLTQDFYQRATTSMLNGIYDWLDGITERPQFEVRISDNPAEFKNFILDAFMARYQTLPLCGPDTVFTTDYNALEADCRVTTISDAQVRAAVESKLGEAELNQLFNSATISSDQFFKDFNPADAANIQRVYRLLKLLNWLLLVAIVLLSLLIGLSVWDRNRSLKTVGKALLVPGVLALIGGLIARLVQGVIIKGLTPATGQQGVGDLANQAVKQLFIQINNRWLAYSGILVLLSIALIISQKLLNQPSRFNLDIKPG